jgi:predicted ATPase/DNA-binding CsgD family transcriptional regulator/DNA-binding XRE family transcriptional regulator
MDAARQQRQPLGQLLRLHRARARLTQRELAAVAGMSARGVQDIERGVSIPHRSTLRRLTRALALRGEERRCFECAARPHGQTALHAEWNAAGNLPKALTSFMGRKHEAAEIAQLLGRSRLLTLTGTGGIGKTRLALQVAASLTANYPDGVWFVNLATVSDPALVRESVATALGLPERRARSLTRAIGSSQRLLLLDNCEHLIDSVAELAAELLYACPAVVLLATSREPLRLSCEVRWPVPPLSLPTPEVAQGSGGVLASDAIALFVERAQAIRPNFTLNADTTAAVVRLCARLAGIPLAIELAAARLRSLSPHAILDMIDSTGRALELLDGGPRDTSPRHRGLRTALDWSFELLSPDEQALFCRLAVFRGCDLQAIDTVCITPADRPGTTSLALAPLHIDALQGVTSLIDKSLLRLEEDEVGDPWYVMLEPIRDFALDRLQSSGLGSVVRRRHALECMHIVEQTQEQSSYWPGLPSTADRLLLDRLEREHANCREALDWCLAQGYAEPCFRLAIGLWWFWAVRGYTREGRNWISKILARFHDRAGHWRHTLLRARTLEAAGRLAMFEGDLHAGRESLEQALQMMDELEDNVGLFSILEGLGLVCHQLGDTNAARRYLERGLAVALTFGGLTRIADGLYNLGNLALEEGDAAQAHAFLDQSAVLCEQAGEPRSVAVVLLALSGLDQQEGQIVRARQRTRRALTIFEQCGDARGAALALANLGSSACATREFTLASEYLMRSLSLVQQTAEPASVARVLDSLAVLAAARRQDWRALRLAGAAASVREQSQVQLLPVPRRRLESELDQTRQALGPKAEDAFNSGRGLLLADAVAEAMALAQAPSISDAGEATLGLSRREIDVVALIALGRTNRQIADQLIIGEATVATHVLHIRNKLELNSRTQVAAWAVAHGLLNEPPGAAPSPRAKGN